MVVHLTNRKRALLYRRISPRPEQDFGNTSLEKQLEDMMKYCQRNNIEVVDVYTDNLKSGKSFEGRDEFKEMYHRALKTEEEIDYVIVLKQDRLSRDTLDTLFIMKRLNEAGVNLISIADNINTNDRNAEILVHVMSLVAQLERDFINYRTRSGMEKKAEDGFFLGGQVFGYKSFNKKLRVLPREARVVKYIFEKYAVDMWGYKKIASSLNMQGIKTKNKKDWTINAVKTVLENQIYIGSTKWRGEYTKGNHTPIIEKSLWEKTQEVMQTRSYTPVKIHSGSYPLSGLIKCPRCGSSMVQGNCSQKYKYYQCSKNKNSGRVACTSNLINKEYAEDYVLRDFLNHLQNEILPLLLHDITKANLDYELKPLEEEIRYLNKEIEELQKGIETTLDLFDDNSVNIDPDLLKNRLVTKQNAINEKKSIVKELTKQVEFKRSNSFMEIIRYSIENFKDFYSTLADEEKKKFFHSVIRQIHINQGEKPKDRLITDIEYFFDLDDISNLVNTKK
ncbi:recombinase family protein [Filobacillus milosensis]|uniref:Recombinase family protein n=1 Tax=Filobacillus milosensis TaxID=94137 RepID=A0A4Y8ICA3_9BACI|nr:recombinase family protein [Filobacillus milosensis]TFB13590.1 recombinase family protein [Filobacillus milosensis]